jgi:hypothetical protein
LKRIAFSLRVVGSLKDPRRIDKVEAVCLQILLDAYVRPT